MSKSPPAVKDVIPSIVPPFISAVEVITLPNDAVESICNLPNEPVDVIEPLITLFVPVLIILPVAVTSSNSISPVKSVFPAISNLPNEPVDVIEPETFPPKSLAVTV